MRTFPNWGSAFKCVIYTRSLVTKSGKLSENVILPKTDFPHWVDPLKRTARDKKIQDDSRFSSLYSWQLENNKGDLFILHDGPPYANGKLHLGHAVNKISKDIAIRYKILKGQKAHYVPGWDCHGLPIELKAVNQNKTALLTPLEIRYKAEKMAQSTIEHQIEMFQQWGITGDWSNYYRTTDPHYIKNQLQAFYTLYEKGLIFRDYKPVYWSPSSHTALADAELEYNTQHKSLSAYVTFPLKDIPDSLKQCIGDDKIFAAVWTTTPWTLPANQCIGFMPDKDYSLVKVSGIEGFIIIASEMISEMQNALNAEIISMKTFPGIVLKYATYCHPLYPDSAFLFVENNKITMTIGTGLVHMAPNHGHEDYLIAVKNNIPLAECIVDENGYFSEKAQKELTGLFAFTDGTSTVLKLLKEYILCTEEYIHSYPYDWRSKQPIIVRSSYQWFVNTDALKDKALSELDCVTVYPTSAKKALQKAIENCPPWCISRQRVWGIPIPVFYELPERKPIITKNIVDHISDLTLKNGIHCWWSLPPEVLLPRKVLTDSNLPVDKVYEAGKDILDIWFDSGLSWLNVLPKGSVADLYLEGIDQIRGWFQSSLWMSVALRGCSPYKSLFIHGFTVDSQGRKMSKSLGNVISPELIINGGKDVKANPPYGIDVLRWWVASHACQYDNVSVGNHIIKECSESVNKLRNVLRFLLGNTRLYNESYICPMQSMNLLDRYMLHLLYGFTEEIFTHFDDFKYGHAARQIFKFVTNDVSAYYCHLVKDRLYCEKETSINRLSCVTALFHILITLTSVLFPILPHLAEEVRFYMPRKQVEAFDMRWKGSRSDWFDKDLSETFRVGNIIRDVVNENTKGLNSREVDVTICARGSFFSHLKLLQKKMKCTESQLCELLQVSQVTLSDHLPVVFPDDANIIHGKMKSKQDDKENDFTILILPAEMNKCDRCRRYTSKVKGELCSRCLGVVESREIKAVI